MFEKIMETELYRGQSIRFCIDHVRLPNGQEIDQEVLRHPGSVVVLPMLDAHHILLLKQYRYIINREIYEIPAGKLEHGENPETAGIKPTS
jgi:ADP-ribose pyrophosphatase